MKRVLFAIGLGAVMATAASAAPASSTNPVKSPAGTALPDGFAQIQHRPEKDDHSQKHRPHHRYVPGSHHKSAPHGWHRHRHRPHDWRARGCIVVGPVWFCP
jgi:hypothetical protein